MKMIIENERNLKVVRTISLLSMIGGNIGNTS